VTRNASKDSHGRTTPPASHRRYRAQLLAAAQPTLTEQGFENTQLEEVAAPGLRAAQSTALSEQRDLFLELLSESIDRPFRSNCVGLLEERAEHREEG